MKQMNGLITALITPFKEGKIDFGSLEKLIRHQVDRGVSGFVVNGTTGESPTLSDIEVQNLFKFCQKMVPKAFPLILGTGTNSTQTTIEKTRMAAELGADSALVVVPYYNKPPQRGLFKHFSEVANCGGLPVILYNVPGRTITSLEVDTVVSLSENRNIIGIKEASGKVQIAAELRKGCRKDFLLLSGDDGTYVEFLEAGGDGVISVASHVIPDQMKRWRALFLSGDVKRAYQESARWRALLNLLCVEANPIPIKKAAQILGLIESAELRLPLVELESKNAELLREEMLKLGLIL
ncbi:MAG: 4-hydroxy-tetrahydrodipicolinate synthase [Bdellovibrionaceae bacterium]|nr:4-hydroxy-tetrahydrodipicolinate synthase [Pseudobdellovibrionaceae bacterium]